ncbi:hypothetical protein [Nostoc sp. UHCC 0870]|uniref:hypothetical protein n=1 Tax=Nostoc sp. UHCC 0870 TaxID=2914041 RepID=UPI001EDEF859|nr:hypothetical protein [Nostoc sp. UHCC 0870]UKO99995.1 hypothetical protein L6494_09950 [Nostoc sp. UHCC 0870]
MNSNFHFYRNNPEIKAIIKDFLNRIANNQHGEKDIKFLEQLLNLNPQVEIAWQMRENIVNIQEGKDIHIGNRIYSEWNQEMIEALVKAIQTVNHQNNLDFNSSDISENIFIDISVITQNNEKNYNTNKEPRVNYKVTKINDVIKIKGSIEPIEDDYVLSSSFSWDYPDLDVKILNNSKNTIFITAALLEIEENRLDPYPVLITKPYQARYEAFQLYLKNLGWGDVQNLKARFHLIPLSLENGKDRIEPNFTEPYPHEVVVESFRQRDRSIDISTAFWDAGVDIHKLKSLNYHRDLDKKAPLYFGSFKAGSAYVCGDCLYFGHFKTGVAYVCGELNFQAYNIEGLLEEKTLKFSTIVKLFDDLVYCLSPALPTVRYGTEFQVEGEKYERRVEISHTLKPGEADRFTITIGMDRSSRHRFKVKLICINGAEVLSPMIEMLTVIPNDPYYSSKTFQEKERLTSQYI